MLRMRCLFQRMSQKRHYDAGGCPHAQRQRVGDIPLEIIGAFRNMIRSFWWNREERSIAKKAFPAC